MIHTNSLVVRTPWGIFLTSHYTFIFDDIFQSYLVFSCCWLHYKEAIMNSLIPFRPVLSWHRFRVTLTAHLMNPSQLSFLIISLIKVLLTRAQIFVPRDPKWPFFIFTGSALLIAFLKHHQVLPRNLQETSYTIIYINISIYFLVNCNGSFVCKRLNFKIVNNNKNSSAVINWVSSRLLA